MAFDKIHYPVRIKNLSKEKQTISLRRARLSETTANFRSHFIIVSNQTRVPFLTASFYLVLEVSTSKMCV